MNPNHPKFKRKSGGRRINGISNTRQLSRLLCTACCEQQEARACPGGGT